MKVFNGGLWNFKTWRDGGLAGVCSFPNLAFEALQNF
jgi:hypothetical protein